MKNSYPKSEQNKDEKQHHQSKTKKHRATTLNIKEFDKEIEEWKKLRMSGDIIGETTKRNIK